MTAENIFDTAVTLMFGTTEDKEDYQPLFLNILNLLLAENFDNNNALRVAAGKEAMSEIPNITEITQEVDYEEAMTRQILPYGCAGYIYSDDNKNMGSEYKNKYEYERARVRSAVQGLVRDVYK